MREVWVPLLVDARGEQSGWVMLPKAPSSLLRLSFRSPTHPYLKLGPIHGHARAAGAAEPSEVVLGVGPPDDLLQLPVHMDIAVHRETGQWGARCTWLLSSLVRAGAPSGDQGAGPS